MSVPTIELAVENAFKLEKEIINKTNAVFINDIMKISPRIFNIAKGVNKSPPEQQ